jgi:hypothetical protein
MGKLPDSSDGDGISNDCQAGSSGLMFFAVIADTTWRMFVPSVGLTLLGVWLDSEWHMKPWFMISGIVVGTIAAIALVRRQINSINTNRNTL